MNTIGDTLKSFLDRIKLLGFFQRLFGWKNVRTHLIDATAAYSNLITQLEDLQVRFNEQKNKLEFKEKDIITYTSENSRLLEAQKNYNETIATRDNKIADLNKSLTTANANCGNYQERVETLNKELTAIKTELQHIEEKFDATIKETISLKNEEESRKSKHSEEMNTLKSISERIQKERDLEQQQQHQVEVARLTKLKETWSNHESNVKNYIKTLCNKHTIEYVEKVPFKGEPDNTLKICDEYIVFDAKSPAGEDLNNFPNYLKDQSEKAKKYAKIDNVKTDIFFVVPSNTLGHLRQTVYNLGDHNVYIISADSLEPIILSLKKIESYDFAQQLSPEERENICRIIGKFAHLTKRRIQIDSFFARQFMELVYKCESSLPDDILESVAEFEKAERLNPPMERRTKAINTKQLDTDLTKLETEVGGQGIALADLSEGLNKVKLYSEQK